MGTAWHLPFNPLHNKGSINNTAIGLTVLSSHFRHTQVVHDDAYTGLLWASLNEEDKNKRKTTDQSKLKDILRLDCSSLMAEIGWNLLLTSLFLYSSCSHWKTAPLQRWWGCWCCSSPPGAWTGMCRAQWYLQPDDATLKRNPHTSEVVLLCQHQKSAAQIQVDMALQQSSAG